MEGGRFIQASPFISINLREVYTLTEHFNQLSNILGDLGRTRDLSRVFNDLLSISICSFHRVNIQSQLQEKDPDNEKLYMEIIQSFKKEELGALAKALAHLQLNVLDRPYSDLLGDYFTEYITRGENGQFFTPDPICELMTRLQGEDQSIKKQRVLDPACGSGRTLLNFAKVHPDNYFFGADNHQSCAKMTVLNFFLNGLRGEVAWMNTLSMEFFGAWHINTDGLGIRPIEKEQSQIWSAPSKRKPIEFKEVDPLSGGSQLEMF